MNLFIIEQEKLINNINIVKKRAGAVKIFAVIKGDGYGFGLIDFARLLRDNGIDSFAVTEPRDVKALRDAGFIDEDILMLRSTAIADELDSLISDNAILTIGSSDAAAAANGIAGKLDIAARAHIKIDTGMGRYGFDPDAHEQIKAVFEYMPNLKIEGLYTHLNRAFSSRKKTLNQINRLYAVEARIKESGFDPGMVHFANSSALFRYNIELRDAVRIGSAFTGRLAFPNKSGLQKVGYLESRVCEIRWLVKGGTVGYGGAYRARRAVKIAVLPLGYSHGFGVEKIRDTYRFRDGVRYVLQDIKRTLFHETITVRINGKNARVLGHIGMLHTVVDITDIPCEIGDRAVFDISPLYVDGKVEKKYV